MHLSRPSRVVLMASLWTLAPSTLTDRGDGTYAGIDRSMAHLNISATFAWARGLETRPIRVTFHLPDPTWTVATQLFPTADSTTFTDAAVSIAPQNKGNTFISYYPFGEAIALALDLTLRGRGKTLDDFMREMWKSHGRQLG